MLPESSSTNMTFGATGLIAPVTSGCDEMSTGAARMGCAITSANIATAAKS